MKMQPIAALFCIAAGMALAPNSAHATLIGLSPYLPTLDFSGSGTINYHAGTGVVSISGEPSALFSFDPFILSEIQNTVDNTPRALSIQFQVDNNGSLIPNSSNAPDLVLIGAIDIDGDSNIDYSGTLLTAKVSQFGFLDSTTGDDQFDFSLDAIGGSLAYLYGNNNLASLVISEASSAYTNPFGGSFDTSWQGQAKGIIGLIPLPLTSPVPLPPSFWLWAGALASIIPGIKRIKPQPA